MNWEIPLNVWTPVKNDEFFEWGTSILEKKISLVCSIAVFSKKRC
jgi:hypothetical protein